MKIPALAFTTTDWSAVPAVEYPGETGKALWRSFTVGDLRVRLVDYSAGYLADHRIQRGSGGKAGQHDLGARCDLGGGSRRTPAGLREPAHRFGRDVMAEHGEA